MIDTIAITSPALDTVTLKKVEQSLIRKSAVEVATGNILYEAMHGDLQGSFERRIGCKLTRNTDGTCLRVECSVHKQLIGHNCYGGPANRDYQKCVWFLVGLLESILEVRLPVYEEWSANRIDVAEAFALLDQITDWFRGMNNSKYPRRKVNKYGETGIMFPGSTTSFKFYDKNCEYKANDYKHIKLFDIVKAHEILKLSKGLLRAECSIKQRKINYDFKQKEVKIKQITGEYLDKIYDNEVTKIMQSRELFEVVTEGERVIQRLNENYTDSLAGSLFATWSKFSVFGEDYCKKNMHESKYYRHKRLLKDVGISWHCTDIVLRDVTGLIGFMPLRSSPARLTETYDFEELKAV